MLAFTGLRELLQIKQVIGNEREEHRDLPTDTMGSPSPQHSQSYCGDFEGGCRERGELCRHVDEDG